MLNPQKKNKKPAPPKMSNSTKNSGKVYAGGSPNFDESTGKYRRGYVSRKKTDEARKRDEELKKSRIIKPNPVGSKPNSGVISRPTPVGSKPLPKKPTKGIVARPTPVGSKPLPKKPGNGLIGRPTTPGSKPLPKKPLPSGRVGTGPRVSIMPVPKPGSKPLPKKSNSPIVKTQVKAATKKFK